MGIKASAKSVKNMAGTQTACGTGSLRRRPRCNGCGGDVPCLKCRKRRTRLQGTAGDTPKASTGAGDGQQERSGDAE